MTRLSELMRGIPGQDGVPVEIQKGVTHIQWRYVGLEPADEWKDIIAIADLIGEQGEQGLSGAQGEPGDSPEMRVYDGYIQWKLSEDVSWTNLIAVEDLVGESVRFTICFLRTADTPTKPSATTDNVAAGWSRTVEIAEIDGETVADAISTAISSGSGTEYDLFVVAEAIEDRPLADINDDTNVNTTDAFLYYQHIIGGTQRAYIHDTMHPYMAENKATYADYFTNDNPLWGCVGKWEDDYWVWDEPILMEGSGGGTIGNIDGGRADEVYTIEQTIDGGTA